MNGNTTRPPRRWRLILASLLAVLLLMSLIWDWNWLKRPIAYGVEQATGRRLAIDGDLDVDLGWRPRIVVEKARFANPEWARTPEMIKVERAEVTVDLLALFKGTVMLPRVDLVAPQVELETSATGLRNWQLKAPPAQPDPSTGDKELPQIGALNVERGELGYVDPASKTDLRMELKTRTEDGGNEVLVAKASGTMRSLELEADATAKMVLALTDLDAPYPFRARLRLGQTRVGVEGTVTGLPQLRAARLQIDLRGNSLAALHPLTALTLPETPPYHIAGLLVREGERWTFDDFQGEVGDSDLSGDVTVTYAQGRPRMVATLQSRQLDLDDLAGFVGATPGTGKGETASPQQERQAIVEEASPRMLPDRPVDLAGLRAMDADVQFTGLSIRNQKLPLDNLAVHLLLEQGRLRLDPLNFGVASGQIVSTLLIDAREPLLALETSIDFTRLDLAKLLPGNARVEAGAGLIGGRARLRGNGASTAALLASANGELGIAMRDGRFSNLLIEGVGLDAAEALRLLIGGDRSVELRCAVLDFEVKDGVLTPRAFVVDTTDTNLQVDGSLSLVDESLDLTIHPLPKDFSPLSLRSPLHVRGTFKNPKIRPDKTLLARGGAAVLLAALVNPLAALLPLIETGPGKNENCDALVTAVRRQVPAGQPS
ncbi:MAG: AsmA family protein [Panacagrimonas sp.]